MRKQPRSVWGPLEQLVMCPLSGRYLSIPIELQSDPMPTPELSVLREDALALSEADRAILAHDLVASLDGPADPDVAKAWDREIVLRINDIDAGKASLLDASEVIADIRNRIS